MNRQRRLMRVRQYERAMGGQRARNGGATTHTHTHTHTEREREREKRKEEEEKATEARERESFNRGSSEQNLPRGRGKNRKGGLYTLTSVKSCSVYRRQPGRQIDRHSA